MKKNVVLLLEIEYLNEAAKARGVSRTRLALLLMEKIIGERLVSNLVGDDRIVIQKPLKYRRFKTGN